VKLATNKKKGVPEFRGVAEDVVIQTLHGQIPIESLSFNLLPKSNLATMYISPSSQQITRIILDAPTTRAKVRALDGDTGRLTVLVDEKEVTFALPPGIKVMELTRVRHLPDVKPDAIVSLVFSLDRSKVLAIDLRN
jgi:hypothetical protein